MSPLRTAKSYWIFCLLLLPLAIFCAFDRHWAQTADMWETAAAIRAAAQDLLHPANPMLALPGDTSPRFTPYVLFWAAVSRYLNLDLFTVVGLAGVLNFLLFVTGLAHWITRQFRNPHLALVVLLAMLFICGTGYEYANAYQFGFFFASLAYVGTFVYGLCFHALAYLRKYLDEHAIVSLVAYTLLSVLAFVTHPITAAFLFVAALAMLISEGNWRRIALLQIVPLVSVGFALLWPYFDYWTVLFKGSTETWFPAALFAHQVVRMGPALLGLVIVGLFAYQRRHRFVVLGTFFCLAIYALSGAFKFYMGSRFLLYGAIFLHLAIALYLIEDWPHWWKSVSFRRPRTLTKFALVLLIILPSLPFRAHELYLAGDDISHAAFATPQKDTPADRFAFLSPQLSPADVVMAEDDTGWPVPALTGAKLVWQQKGDPLIQDQISQRREDAQQFFRAPLSLEQRRALLNRYHADYILVDMWWQNRWDHSFLDQISLLGKTAAVRGPVVLYRVNT